MRALDFRAVHLGMLHRLIDLADERLAGLDVLLGLEFFQRGLVFEHRTQRQELVLCQNVEDWVDHGGHRTRGAKVLT